jgi:hypothetical protein
LFSSVYNQMVLACLMALAAAIDESQTVVQVADLDVAEHRRHGGYYGGQRGYGHGGYGHGGYYGGHRWGRKRRSIEEEALSSDLEAAEGTHRGWGHRVGGYNGGWSGRRGGYNYGGYGYYG